MYIDRCLEGDLYNNGLWTNNEQNAVMLDMEQSNVLADCVGVPMHEYNRNMKLARIFSYVLEAFGMCDTKKYKGKYLLASKSCFFELLKICHV